MHHTGSVRDITWQNSRQNSQYVRRQQIEEELVRMKVEEISSSVQLGHADTHHTASYSNYDTTPDAILACARKPTRVSLIYRTEPTTKKVKKNRKKLKVENRYAQNSKQSGGIHVVNI